MRTLIHDDGDDDNDIIRDDNATDHGNGETGDDKVDGDENFIFGAGVGFWKRRRRRRNRLCGYCTLKVTRGLSELWDRF